MSALVPPFTRETAIAKVRMAEDAWNSRDPHRVFLTDTLRPAVPVDADLLIRSLGARHY